MPAIWSFRAPMAFMTPIWRVCWARMADTVLTTRKPETTSARAPMKPSTRKKPCSRSLAGWRPGTGTKLPKTVTPARSSLAATSSATTCTPALSRLASATRMRSSSKLVPIAQVAQRLGRHVAGDPSDVEGWRRADLVRWPRRRGVGLAVDRLDGQRAGLGSSGSTWRELRSTTTSPRSGGQPPRSRIDQVQSLVLEVRDGGQEHLAVAAIRGLQADRHAPAALGVRDAAHVVGPCRPGSRRCGP